ncbi:MAG: NmrA/HSCARG family protein [Bacteroidota bacterium]
MQTNRQVFVFGATGQQGSSLIEALLPDGHHITGLSRNPDSPKAQALRSQGIQMKKGDFTDEAALTELMQGMDTVFFMTTPFEKGTEHETQQGITVANAAKQAGVGHLIYSSVGGANLGTGIPHFDSKYLVEQHIQSLGIPYTIIAPVYFMENAISPWSLEALKEGVIRQAMPGDRLLQQVSVKDIGKMAAIAVNRRESMFGKRIDLAGDNVTGEQAAHILSQASGKSIRYEGFPADILKTQNEDLGLMYEWFDKVGYSSDIDGLHAEYPELQLENLQNWAAKQDWTVLN